DLIDVERQDLVEPEKSDRHLASLRNAPANLACISCWPRSNLSSSRLLRTGAITMTRPSVETSTLSSGSRLAASSSCLSSTSATLLPVRVRFLIKVRTFCHGRTYLQAGPDASGARGLLALDG